MIHSDVEIHPRAYVSPEAELEPNVVVGPGAVVEKGARVGEGTHVMANAVVTRHATIGRRCRIHYGAIIGGDPQDVAFEGGETRVVLGDDVVVREHATIHRATKPASATRIGSGCYLMVNSHVAHDCVLGEKVIVCNSALVAGHCVIGDRAFLSGNAVVHQFARVGPLVMLSGISGIGRDVGPYLIVAGRSQVRGFNMVGMRRAGFDAAARRRVQEGYAALFDAPTLKEGVAALLQNGAATRPELAAITDFFAVDSKRGYSRPKKAGLNSASAEDAE